MLNAKRESLAGKLLLSSALVAVSLGYGWWQSRNVEAPKLAMAPMPVPPVKPLAQSPPPPAQTEMQAAAPEVKDAPGQTIAPPKSVAAAKAAPQVVAPSATPATPVPQQAAEPSAPVQLQAMIVPTDGASLPFPLVTGTPEAGAVVALPAGMHLADGETVSDRHSLMWGDLKVRISIQGGAIAGVQVLLYPDHRSQSLYLSQLALPTLASEVIKNQKAQVDVVSSATDTSYTFQDAVADAIAKATRG